MSNAGPLQIYNNVNVTKRLDQGHLHPKLEVPAGNQTLASAVGGEHSRKELTDLLQCLSFVLEYDMIPYSFLLSPYIFFARNRIVGEENSLIKTVRLWRSIRNIYSAFVKRVYDTHL